mmetsp:Transcript_5356/g.33576  ORF Transcript_5356/g.33576 Transcript_5356/m.33576 type:complete len:230 (+) Transcript_5356:952-1641(+)
MRPTPHLCARGRSPILRQACWQDPLPPFDSQRVLWPLPCSADGGRSWRTPASADGRRCARLPTRAIRPCSSNACSNALRNVLCPHPNVAQVGSIPLRPRNVPTRALRTPRTGSRRAPRASPRPPRASGGSAQAHWLGGRRKSTARRPGRRSRTVRRWPVHVGTRAWPTNGTVVASWRRTTMCQRQASITPTNPRSSSWKTTPTSWRRCHTTRWNTCCNDSKKNENEGNK